MTVPKATLAQFEEPGGALEPQRDLASDHTDEATEVLVGEYDQLTGFGLLPEQLLYKPPTQSVRVHPEPETDNFDE